MRTRLLLLPALFAVAVFALGCGSEDEQTDGGGPAQAKALLDRALSRNVESGEIRLTAAADLAGSKDFEDPIKLTVSGPFESNGRDKLPSVDFDVDVTIAGQSLGGRVALADDNAFVELQGRAYEAGAALIEQVNQSIAASAPKDGETTLKDFGIDAAGWLEDPQVSEGDAIGGDATRKVTGSVDARKVVEDFAGLVESPTIKRQLERSGEAVPDVPSLGEADLDKVEDAIEDVSFEANVDDAGNLRRLLLEVDFKIPEGVDADGLKGGKVTIDYTLAKLGAKVDPEAPANARPIGELLQGLGLLGSG